jgi:DNA-binding winged helix-turn-helix (wHTH) protein
MSELARPATDYRFLHWSYTSALRLLRGPAGEVRLKPLSDRLLRCLLDAPGTVLAREQLIAQVWTRREVNDEVLSRAVAELRAVLGDDAREPRFIETLSKGGYRWIAPVTQVLPVSAQALLDRPPAASAPVRRHRYAVFVGAALALLGLTAWLHSQWRGGDAHDRATLATHLLAARPLTADPRLEYDARFDSMGQVVYVRADQGSAVSELIMVDPASSAERVLWKDTSPLRHPAPSPNGREIAVTRWSGEVCELWSVALMDLRRTRIGDCASSVRGGIEWVDGGDALIHTGAAAGPLHAPGLVLLDRRSGTQRVLTTPGISEGAHVDPRLSADGRQLVYASKHGNEGQLWLTDWPQQRQRRALLKRPEPLFGHAFDPRGDGLWVAGDLTLYRALHRLRDGGEPELIGGRGARTIDVAATGAAVWSEANYDADIWLRGSADAPWTAIARSNRYESQPEFSADGSRLALVSNRNGAESVLVYDRADHGVRQLPLDPAFRWVRPTWSARDESLIITAYEDHHTRLYRYRLDADRPLALPHIGQGAFHGIELADRLIYLIGHGTEQSRLMQLRKGHTQSENLGLGPVTAFRASEDWLVWRDQGSHGLRAVPLPAMQPVQEIARVDEGMVEAFAVAGNTLHFVDQGKLWTLSLPGGEPVPVATAHLPNGVGPSLAVTANGAMAVVTLTSLSIDLMIAD